MEAAESGTEDQHGLTNTLCVTYIAQFEKQTKNNHFHLVEARGKKKPLESVWMQENIYDDYMKDARMEKVMQT